MNKLKLFLKTNMGRFTSAAIFVLWLLLYQTNCCIAQKNNGIIQFIPETFHNVKLGFDENTIHQLTPYYPQTIYKMSNEIAINIPHKIIYKQKINDLEYIIPVCGFFEISERRMFKYYDHINLLIHIKKVGTTKSYYGEIIGDNEDESPELSDYSEEKEKQIQIEIKKAQNYSDDELNNDLTVAVAININALKYVEIPLESGIYEIYLTKSGLESNHAEVEIIFEK